MIFTCSTLDEKAINAADDVIVVGAPPGGATLMSELLAREHAREGTEGGATEAGAVRARRRVSELRRVCSSLSSGAASGADASDGVASTLAEGSAPQTDGGAGALSAPLGVDQQPAECTDGSEPSLQPPATAGGHSNMSQAAATWAEPPTNRGGPCRQPTDRKLWARFAARRTDVDEGNSFKDGGEASAAQDQQEADAIRSALAIFKKSRSGIARSAGNPAGRPKRKGSLDMTLL